MNTFKLLAMVAVLTAGPRGCADQRDDDGDGAVSKSKCTSFCFLPLCNGVTEPGNDYGTVCVDQCMIKGLEAKAIGQGCGDAYSRAIECYLDLTCEDFYRWADGDDTICHGERTAFLEQCPGLEFDFRE
jgi:hypothetical protein